MQYISSNKFALLVDKTDLRKALRQIGNDVKKAAKASIMAAKTGKHYGKHIASRPGEAPATLSGTLSRSIKVSVRRDAVSIKDTAWYAVALEAGSRGGGRAKKGRSAKSRRRYVRGRNTRVATTTRVLSPRPYISTAVASLDVQGILDKSLKNLIQKRTTFK